MLPHAATYVTIGLGRQSITKYIEGQQRVEYFFECPLPAQPVLPAHIDDMSQTSEMSATEYLHCFCVGSSVTLPRNGHRFSSRLGRLTFVVPTQQLLVMRSSLSLAPAAVRPADGDGDAEKSDASCDGQQQHKTPYSARSPIKVVGYARMILQHASKMLLWIATMTLYKCVADKIKLFRRQLLELERVQHFGGAQHMSTQVEDVFPKLEMAADILRALRIFFSRHNR